MLSWIRAVQKSSTRRPSSEVELVKRLAGVEICDSVDVCIMLYMSTLIDPKDFAQALDMIMIRYRISFGVTLALSPPS